MPLLTYPDRPTAPDMIRDGWRADLIAAVFDAAHGDIDPRRIAEARNRPLYYRRVEWEDVLNALAAWNVDTDDLTVCDGCETLQWSSETCFLDHTILCEDCYSASYTECAWCGDATRHEDAEQIEDIGESYCRRCAELYAYWCDECGEWSSDPHDHKQWCHCEARHQAFHMALADGTTLANDARHTVILPRGVIARQGIDKIATLLRNDAGVMVWGDALIEAVGDVWQTRRGNFTRRVSSWAHRIHQVTIPSAILAEIGNIARAFSSDETTFHVELTRDFNRGPAAFYHEDSCWYGGNRSYNISLCALKDQGGIGLRSYASDHADADEPNGRAWIEPITIDEFGDANPTDDPGSGVYVVINCYGALEGYAAARVLAAMIGGSYRKIAVRVLPQYVNGDSGYIVGPSDVIDNIGKVSTIVDVDTSNCI